MVISQRDNVRFRFGLKLNPGRDEVSSFSMCEAHAVAFALVVAAASEVFLAAILLLLFRDAVRHFLRRAPGPSQERTSACRYVVGWLRSTPRACGHRGGPLDSKL